MTMLNTPDVPPPPVITDAEFEHISAMEPSIVAKTIARQNLRVACSDVTAAFHQLEHGTVDEALKIIAEAREQVEAAAAILRGRIWSL